MIDASKISQVVTWKLEGQTVHLISEAIHENWPEDDPEGLIEAADAEIEKVGGWDIAAARFVYSKLIEIGSFSDAARTLKEIERLTKARNPADPEPPPVLVIDPKRATSEINLYERAIRNGWAIPAETMAQLPAILLQVALTGDARSKIAAIRGLTTMHSQNQKSRPAPTKKVRHIHQIRPVTDHNLNDRRTILLERLGESGKDAG